MVKLNVGGNNNNKPKISIKKEGESENNQVKKTDLSGVIKSNKKLLENEEKLKQVNKDNETIVVEYDDEDEEKHLKERRSILIKKWLILISFAVFFVGTSVAALYHVFSYKPYSGQQIAYFANYFNGKTNFPKDGVQNYLTKNINKLAEQNINLQSNSDNNNSTITLDNIRIASIREQTDTLANAYFYVDTHTNGTTTTLYMWMPIMYNSKDDTYYAGSNPVLVSTKSSDSNSKVGESPNLKFNSDDLVDSNKTSDEQAFVDNFFKLFYSGQDISPMYKGTTKLVRDPKVQYNGMTNFSYYSKDNKGGQNVQVTVSLKLDNNLEYDSQKYLKLEKSGSSFIITQMQ